MNKNYIIALLVILCLILFNRNDEVETITVTKTDTVKVQTKSDTIYIEQARSSSDTVWVDRFVYREPPVNAGGDSINVYQDTVHVDSVIIDFSARVDGELKSINFGVTNKYPIVTNTETITVTKETTKIIEPGGLFVGGTFTGNTVSLGATFIKRKHSFTVEYGLDKSVNVGYKFKLF